MSGTTFISSGRPANGQPVFALSGYAPAGGLTGHSSAHFARFIRKI